MAIYSNFAACRDRSVFIVYGYWAEENRGYIVGYTDTLEEAQTLAKHGRGAGRITFSKLTHIKIFQQLKKEHSVAMATINEILRKQPTGPLFNVVTVNDSGIVGSNVYETEKEADEAAARSFTTNNGRVTVLVLKLDKLARPAVPKVDFEPAAK